jgi:hypothetical protein
MNWFSKLKGSNKNAPRPAASEAVSGIYLNALGGAMMASLHALEKAPVDLELLRARLADLCRDLDCEPMDPEEFMRQASALDTDSQRRFALAVAGLDDKPTHAAFTQNLRSASVPQALEMVFDFARKQDLLTVELLIESSLRREEFVRHFISQLGSPVAGETPADSQDRLRRLDYRTLLAEAERAKLSAEDRIAYLKKLQEKQESQLGGRSKI